jgi:hypothetical protein
MNKEKIDMGDAFPQVKGISQAMEWVEIYLVSSELKTIKRKPPATRRVGFRPRAEINGEKAIIFLDVLVEKRSPFDENRTCRLTFTMGALFRIDKELSDEKFHNFIKQYSILSLIPYAREYANDQLRRAGNEDNDAYLPVLDAKQIANELIKGGDFTDAFV